MEEQLKTIKISKKTHNVIKKHCDSKHMKMGKWVESSLLEKIDNEREKNLGKKMS